MDEHHAFIHALIVKVLRLNEYSMGKEVMLHILVGSAQAGQFDKQHLLDEVSATWEAMANAHK
jgi:hypothetical protein